VYLLAPNPSTSPELASASYALTLASPTNFGCSVHFREVFEDLHLLVVGRKTCK
jgi:hypothetical protein